jgi:hypothetical protein
MEESMDQNPSADIFRERDPRAQLRAQGLTLMLTGAGWAAAIFFGALFFILILAGVGRLLPDAARETPDPSLGTTSVVIEAPRPV